MRVRRKDTIFRVYLVCFSVLSVGSVAFLLSGQARYHRASVDRLESRIAELEQRLSDLSSRPAEVSAASDVQQQPKRKLTINQNKALNQREELYFVEGSGYNKRYAYFDLRFYDGHRARYYFRPYASKAELVDLHKRIEHDALDHYYLPEVTDDWEDDSFSARSAEKNFFGTPGALSKA